MHTAEQTDGRYAVVIFVCVAKLLWQHAAAPVNQSLAALSTNRPDGAFVQPHRVNSIMC